MTKDKESVVTKWIATRNIQLPDGGALFAVGDVVPSGALGDFEKKAKEHGYIVADNDATEGDKK